MLREFLSQQKQQLKSVGGDPWPLLADDEKSKAKLEAKMPSASSPAESGRLDGLAPRCVELWTKQLPKNEFHP